MLPYNADSTILTKNGREFIERMAPGWANDSIASRDITIHYTHDKQTRPPLGRTSSGTLRLSGQDEIGLRFWNDTPEWAQDIRESVARGDLHGVSFGMADIEDEWNKRADGMQLRTIKRATLDHIAIVLSPAYEGSHVSVRSNVEIPDDNLAMAEIILDLMKMKVALLNTA